MSASAGAVALAVAVGGDIKVLTAQLQAANQTISNLTDELETAKSQIQQLISQVAELQNPPPG